MRDLGRWNRRCRDFVEPGGNFFSDDHDCTFFSKLFPFETMGARFVSFARKGVRATGAGSQQAELWVHVEMSHKKISTFCSF